MSKFCPMCNEITNCTDNCKNCLEEEERNKNLFGCEAIGYCPFNNQKEGFQCPNCPYEKYGGYYEEENNNE